jgi:hypothetical protein
MRRPFPENEIIDPSDDQRACAQLILNSKLLAHQPNETITSQPIHMHICPITIRRFYAADGHGLFAPGGRTGE